MNIWEKLSNGGGFSLPYLLHIYTNTKDYYLINDNKDLTYNGQLYTASSFSYNPDNQGAATLEIDIVENHQLINIFEGIENINVDVIGVMLDDIITPLEYLKHKHCLVTWTENKAKLKLMADDRLDMTFPALIFNTYNNRGNS